MGLVPESSPERWRTYLRIAAGAQITTSLKEEVVTRNNDRSYSRRKIIFFPGKPDCNEYNLKRLISNKWRESSGASSRGNSSSISIY